MKPKFWQTAKGNMILAGVLGVIGSVLVATTRIDGENKSLNVIQLLFGLSLLGMFDGILETTQSLYAKNSIHKE